jgi:2-polyprenyl-6-methoxyphenol hydroxylase-like FAD-dependent oxidoreductase
MRHETADILIIGAGPAGAVAAGLLRKQGREVLILEREQFPRFSIGESLPPQSMQFIEAAGMLQDVVEAGFQYKNGAAFVRATSAPSSISATSSAPAGAPPTRCSAPISTRCWPMPPSAPGPGCATATR